MTKGTELLACGCLILLLASTSFSAPNAQAKAPAVKCSGCHRALLPLLPASHKGYKITGPSACFTCHRPKGKAKPLGERIHTLHLERKPGVMNRCLSCHTVNKQGAAAFSFPGMKADQARMEAVRDFFKSWASSPYLDHLHKEKGVYCLGCHSNYLDEVEAGETQEGCIRCHGGYEEMIKRTAKSCYEKNPHKSHYIDLKCGVCHHGHGPFTDYCAKCHNFGFKGT